MDKLSMFERDLLESIRQAESGDFSAVHKPKQGRVPTLSIESSLVRGRVEGRVQGSKMKKPLCKKKLKFMPKPIA